MKLQDILKREKELSKNILHHLEQTKKYLMSYAGLNKGRFDAELESMYDEINENFGLSLDDENKIYNIISIIDSWILSLHRIKGTYLNQDDKTFTDDEVEKHTVFKVKEG